MTENINNLVVYEQNHQFDLKLNSSRVIDYIVYVVKFRSRRLLLCLHHEKQSHFYIL